MKTKRRWMNWIIEADADAVTLPWARGDGRRSWKDQAARRARAA